MSQTCPACSEPAPDGAAWCEACGADLGAAPGEAIPAGEDGSTTAPPSTPGSASTATGSVGPVGLGQGNADISPTDVAAVEIPPAPTATEPCIACGALPIEITADGWCGQCGQRQPSPRDHEVVDHGWVAGASDKGKSHHQNEDAMALWVGDDPGHTVIVVCDGVSSTELPEEASTAAANSSLDVLRAAASAGPVTDADFAGATEAAKAQVAAVWRSSARATDPPSCTLVAATATQDGSTVRVQVGWLGDSRAYWVTDESAQLLTRDHSWAQEQRSIGTLDEDTITSDPRAHSITRWIGLDAGDVTPDLGDFTFEAPGRLIVCSDGLWNYAAAPEALAEVIADSSSAAEAELSEAELVESLVAFANAGGGHDNITVVSARFARPGDPEPPETQETPELPETPETQETPELPETRETGAEGSG